MHLVTARYRIVLAPSSHQRGHVSLQVAALDCSATAPLSPSSTAWVCQSVHAALLRPVQGLAEVHSQCFAIWQPERCGAGCGHGSLRIVAGIPVRPSVRDPQLRQSYITPHCIKCWSSHSQAHFVALHRFAPFGFTQQALCKIAYAGAGLSAACTPQPLRVLRAVACRPCVVLALWHMSGALRMVLVSGCAVYLVCAPPTLRACLLRSIARAVCPSAPKGLPQNRASQLVSCVSWSIFTLQRNRL